MYSKGSQRVLAFHGCDRTVAESVLSGRTDLLHSENDYDWLGHGIYFWENDPKRAFQYAQFIKKHPKRTKTPINEPFVIGAVILIRAFPEHAFAIPAGGERTGRIHTL